MNSLLNILAASLSVAFSEPGDAANWECADPLIERNYTRTMQTQQNSTLFSAPQLSVEALADRIYDECLIEFNIDDRSFPENLDPTGRSIFLSMYRRTYIANSSIFRIEIRNKIDQKIRSDKIILH